MTSPAGLVAKALRTGQLVRQPCENCGREPTEGHHDDYAKPLDVRWLCKGCHTEWHSNNEPLNRPAPRPKPDASPTQLRLAERIRRARKDAGLTQAGLAIAAGVTTRTIQWYESGDRQPYADTLYLIAMETGRTMSWFLRSDNLVREETP